MSLKSEKSVFQIKRVDEKKNSNDPHLVRIHMHPFHYLKKKTSI